MAGALSGASTLQPPPHAKVLWQLGLGRTGAFQQGGGTHSFVSGIAATKLPKFTTKYSIRIHVKMLISVSGSLRQTVLSGDFIFQPPQYVDE